MENVIERTVALTDGDIIERRDLPSNIGGDDEEADNRFPAPRVTEEGVNMPQFIEKIESRMIREAMELGGDQGPSRRPVGHQPDHPGRKDQTLESGPVTLNRRHPIVAPGDSPF